MMILEGSVHNISAQGSQEGHMLVTRLVIVAEGMCLNDPAQAAASRSEQGP